MEFVFVFFGKNVEVYYFSYLSSDMGTFLGKTIKTLLWGSLFVLLGAFFFWLIKFKGNFIEYVGYLNSIGIEEIFSSKTNIENEMSDDEILEEALLDDELSGLLEDDYFLPEDTDMDDGSFGFSGSLNNQESMTWEETAPSISKEDLVNLIKSQEK